MDQLLECLAAEACIVSTCEELSYPFRKYPELAKQLDEEAKTWGVALTGTGVNPGFVMDKLAITLSSVSQRIEHAKSIRVVDASKRRLPLQKKIGAGMSVEEFRAQVAAGVIKHHGLPESIAMVADALGFAVDEITETIEPVVAKEDGENRISRSRRGTGGRRPPDRARSAEWRGKNLHGIADVRRRARSA